MKTTAQKILNTCFVALSLALISPMAQSFTIDTSSTSTSPMTGLWNNENESGWGTAIIQQYGMMFVTMYTYDGNGNPVWYVASNCPVTTDGCTGSLYKVAGGSSPTTTWNGANKAVTEVGALTIAFSDANTGTMNFTINGVSGSKAITRSVFAAAPTAPVTPPATSTVSATCTASNFTLANYNAIALGMTLDQVSQTIGCQNNPTLTSRHTSRVTYGWDAESQVSAVYQLILVYFDPTGVIVTSPYSSGSGSGTFKGASGF